MKVKKSDLIKVAKEMNEKMGLEPPIALDLAVDELAKEIRVNIDQILPEDNFSKQAETVFHTLDKNEVESETEVDEMEEENEIEEEEETEVDEEEVVDIVEKIKGIKKLNDLKEFAKSVDNFSDFALPEYTGLGGLRELKNDMLERCRGEEIEKKKDKKKNTHKKSLSAQAVDFFAELINEETYTKKELVEMGREKFPSLAKSTFATILSDSKNSKYSKFDRIVVEDKDGIFRFVD